MGLCPEDSLVGELSQLGVSCAELPGLRTQLSSGDDDEE